MDDGPDVTLPPPVVVARRARPEKSSLWWALLPTCLVLVGLGVLSALVLAVDTLGHGALLVLEPIADSAVTAPDPARHVVVLVLAVASGLLGATGGSIMWDRRSPATPARVRGLVVAAAASSLAAGVVGLGLGLA